MRFLWGQRALLRGGVGVTGWGEQDQRGKKSQGQQRRLETDIQSSIMEVRCEFGKKQVRGLRKVRLSYTYSVVIFPILEEPKNSNDPVSAWKAVEEKQRQTAEAYWLVTQPSHAALAGELAAALRDDLFGR